ncbi:MAG: hypothetical protein ACRELB_21635 [Polyangiaceae bacterium]
MNEPIRHIDWHSAVLDVVVIASLTILTALHIANLTVFLAVTGPILGARLAAARMLRGGTGGGPAGGALGVLLGLLFLLRRPGA